MVVVVCGCDDGGGGGCDDGGGGGCDDGFVLFFCSSLWLWLVVVVAGFWFLWKLFLYFFNELFILF